MDKGDVLKRTQFSTPGMLDYPNNSKIMLYTTKGTGAILYKDSVSFPRIRISPK